MAAVEGGRLGHRGAPSQCIHGPAAPWRAGWAAPVAVAPPCHRGSRSWLTPAAWVAAVTAALLLVFPVGFPNYDTIYALVWGRELAHGISPDYGAALPPTPHPLTDLIGLVTTPLGDGADHGDDGHRLRLAGPDRLLRLPARQRSGSTAGSAPSPPSIVLTRAPFLSNGLRAYIDLPYIALCLGALLRSRRSAPAPAGRSWPCWSRPASCAPRPGASPVVYWLWLAFDCGRRARTPTRTLAASASCWRRERVEPRARLARRCWRSAGPVLWVALRRDHHRRPALLADRHPGNGRNAETPDRAGRPRPLRAAARSAKCCSGRGWSAPSAASSSASPSCAAARRSASPPPSSPSLAFALLAAAGLAIIARYTMLAGGDPGDLRRPRPARLAAARARPPLAPRWQVFAGLVALMFLVWLPNQWDLDSQVDTDLTNQARIEGDLTDLVDAGAFEPLCGPIAVPNHRAVPRLAFGLDVKPTDDRQRQRGKSSSPTSAATSSQPASPFVIHNFILDPNDPTDFDLAVPRGFQRSRRERVLAGLPPLLSQRGQAAGSFEAAAEAQGADRRRSSPALRRGPGSARLLRHDHAEVGDVADAELECRRRSGRAGRRRAPASSRIEFAVARDRAALRRSAPALKKRWFAGRRVVAWQVIWMLKSRSRTLRLRTVKTTYSPRGRRSTAVGAVGDHGGGATRRAGGRRRCRRRPGRRRRPERAGRGRRRMLSRLTRRRGRGACSDPFGSRPSET